LAAAAALRLVAPALEAALRLLAVTPDLQVPAALPAAAAAQLMQPTHPPLLPDEGHARGLRLTRLRPIPESKRLLGLPPRGPTRLAETRLRLVPEKRRLLGLLLLRLVRGPRPRIAGTPLLVKRLLVMPLLLGLLLLRGPTRIAETPLLLRLEKRRLPRLLPLRLVRGLQRLLVKRLPRTRRPLRLEKRRLPGLLRRLLVRGLKRLLVKRLLVKRRLLGLEKRRLLGRLRRGLVKRLLVMPLLV
tara:strand:- start:38 stop:769 length:732 start_codon:yes stop_codon:yes gene_type:complete